MDEVGIKKYRKLIAELQFRIKWRKHDITNCGYLQRKRMNVDNPYTDYGCGWSAGYNAAMNDVLIMLAQEIDVAEDSWNIMKVRGERL